MGRTQRIRVAIVDDQSVFALAFRRLIENAGMEVVGVAPSVEQGVALVTREAPDVAVVDYMLPDGLGTEVAQRVGDAASPARIVLASGTDTLEARKAAANAGCVAFVGKTDAVHALVPAVRRAAALDNGSVTPE